MPLYVECRIWTKEHECKHKLGRSSLFLLEGEISKYIGRASALRRMLGQMSMCSHIRFVRENLELQVSVIV